MAQLGADFGVGFECFASPMNRRHARFCSAFADTDAPFGSSGNFFSVARSGGLRGVRSAECGPPYDDGIMAMAVRAIDAELASRPAGCPGSFVLVVPDWRSPQPADFVRAAEASPHLSHVLELPKEEHRYLDGFQHLASSASPRYVLGETGSLLIFLQNAAGARAWPVCEAALQRQRREWNLSARGQALAPPSSDRATDAATALRPAADGAAADGAIGAADAAEGSISVSHTTAVATSGALLCLDLSVPFPGALGGHRDLASLLWSLGKIYCSSGGAPRGGGSYDAFADDQDAWRKVRWRSADAEALRTAAWAAARAAARGLCAGAGGFTCVVEIELCFGPPGTAEGDAATDALTPRVVGLALPAV
mmetsp:Transcript_27273/g.87691  ORF Transcript_27273/g.87691 Transcript_27273/m.87691 type:complete len:366 (-) Transcript_27273:150-1247(-)